MSLHETQRTSTPSEMQVQAFDPIPFWDKLGGGWDLFKDRRSWDGTIYKFTNKYPYSSDTQWTVAINVGSGEVEISGPRWNSKTRVRNVRLYQEKKIEFFSAGGKLVVSINPAGVSQGKHHSGSFPIGNPPMGRIPPKGRF